MTPKVNKRIEKGFTLIETLVAIAILLVAISGPLTLATKSLFAALIAKDQLTASFLAQDAVEYIRFKRDSNFLTSGTGWLDGSLASCIAPKKCQVDSVADTITECTGEACDYLRRSENTGFYGYGMGSLTPFRRTVTISLVPPNIDEYNIVVRIDWKTGTFSRSQTAKEHIYNWLK